MPERNDTCLISGIAERFMQHVYARINYGNDGRITPFISRWNVHIRCVYEWQRDR